MEVHGFEQDLEKFLSLTGERAKRIESSMPEIDTRDPIAELSKELHPPLIPLSIVSVAGNTAEVRTFRFRHANPDRALPYFRAGQYVSLKVNIGGVRITRPYSLSSAPVDSLGNMEAAAGGGAGYYELTVRRKDNGFLTGHIWDNWTAGTTVEASGPHGNFYHDPLRDSTGVVGIAGGSGITPFRSMIREALLKPLDMRITLLYGFRKPRDLIFSEELDYLAQKSEGRVKIIYVCSEPDHQWSGPAGLIDSHCISRFTGNSDDKTYFIAGPQELYSFIDQEMKQLAIPSSKIRRELYGKRADITGCPNYPRGVNKKTFNIQLQMGKYVQSLPASASESILVALERAGVSQDSRCRSGECGFCRSELLSGKIFVDEENDGRRAADKKHGFFHSCAAYPLSDLTIKIPLVKP